LLLFLSFLPSIAIYRLQVTTFLMLAKNGHGPFQRDIVGQPPSYLV
jgi:hypothetical protein